jgi:hypothetical protein
MKIMLRAAFAALSIASIGSAYANDSGSQSGGYLYPDYVFPGSVYGGVRAPTQSAGQSGQAVVHTFVTNQGKEGTWLFPPYQGNG